MLGVLIGGNRPGGFQFIDAGKPLTDVKGALVNRKPFNPRAGKTPQEPLNAGDNVRYGTGSSKEHRHGYQGCREVFRLDRWTVIHRKTLLFELLCECTSVSGRSEIGEPNSLHGSS